jgi:hypothetical protein
MIVYCIEVHFVGVTGYVSQPHESSADRSHQWMHFMVGGVKVSRHKGVKASRHKGVKVSRLQGIKVSRFASSSVCVVTILTDRSLQRAQVAFRVKACAAIDAPSLPI